MRLIPHLSFMPTDSGFIAERKEIVRQALTGGSLRNVLALSSSTAVAQAIGILTAPILTRLYLPGEFGAFSIYLSGVMLMSTIVCLRYDTTIVLVKQRRTALLLVLLSAVIAGVLSFGAWVPIMAFEDGIHGMVGLGEHRLLVVLPVSLLLTALYKIASNWSVRRKDFAGLSFSKLWQSLPQTAGQISLGLLHFGAWGLVVGEILGRLLGFLTLAYRGREAFADRMPVSVRRARALLSHYRHFPLYSTWSALINEAGTVAPVFFLAAFYGAGAAGLFALVQRVFALPMDLVGQTALTLYTAEAADAIRNHRRALYGHFRKTFLSLLALAVVPVSLLIWQGPWLFDAVFGHEWHAAGVYAQVLAIAYGLRLAVAPIGQTLPMLGRQKLILVIEMTRLTAVVSVFVCGHSLQLDVQTVLTWYAAILIGFQLWMLFATWKAVKA